MKRRALRIGVAAGVLFAAGVIYVVASDAPMRHIARLIGQAGERQLREPMRTATNGAHVLVFAVDGVGEDELLDVIRGGTAARIRRYLGADSALSNAYAVPGVLSVLPSTTIAAWTSLFTGQPPARTGVPGNEWFARDEVRFYAPAPVSTEGVDHTLAIYTEDLLGSVIRVPTLYEQADVRAFVALSQVHRGADLLVLPELSILGELAGAVATGVAEADDDAVEREVYGELDTSSVDQLVDLLSEHGVPRLQVIYFPGVDLFTHGAEDALVSQRRYLAEVIDGAVGRVLDAYQDAGLIDDTYVLFVSDHGHTPVLADDRHALSTEGDDEPPAVLRNTGFRVRPFKLELEDSERDFQAVVAYQGAMAYVYLADRSTCERLGQPCDWSRPPRHEEDVLSVVRAFADGNRGVGVSALRGALDLIFARSARASGDDAPPFEVWEDSSLVPVAEYLSRNPRPELLTLEARLRDLAVGPEGDKAGDVLLLARSGMELPESERFYFSTEYRSWHGSPTAQDSHIPLILARRGMSTDALREIVHAAVGTTPTQLDVTRLILALLRGPV